MITVYQTPAAWDVPNISPFCLKLETYLRMANLPYQARPGDPRQAPLGKLPYIELDGQRIGDSQQIVAALKRNFGDPIDQHLSPAERARGHLIRRTLEEGAYFAIVYARWGDAAGWRAYQPTLREMLPRFLGPWLLPVIRRQILKAGFGQGTLRHPPSDIYALGKADFDAVAAELGDKPFLFGDQPTSVDAVVYAFTASVRAFPADSPLQRHVLAIPTLIAHEQRMQQRYFPSDRPPGRG